MSTEATIRAAAGGTMPGDTVRIVCPFCNAEHEKSLAITRGTEKTHLLMFRCWRGTCDANGYVLDAQGAGMVITGDREANVATPLKEYQHCSPEFLDDVAIRYHLSKKYLRAQGVRYSDHGGALCMPWRNEDGDQIGWVEKRFTKYGYFHKSHHDLNDRRGTRLAFPRIGRSYRTMIGQDVGILVESLIDAYRVNEYAGTTGMDVCAVALLGADLSSRDALRVSQLFPNIMVLLDPDQWPKGAHRVVKRFAGMPSIVRATTLQSDPKDASDADLETVFERCREMLCA